ncbi:hypothetical protein FOCC_FOCC000044 [Frankliniella occidentalis]|nr:hypothetical protein FOCC_FOCC000044 [Frankliniella occidentalis]
MAMNESETEVHLENIPVETHHNFDDRTPEVEHPAVNKNIESVVLTNTSKISALTEFANATVVGAEKKDVSPKSDEKETSSMEQVLVPSTSEPEMELQNEGEDEGFKGFESIDDIEIDAEQMLQIVNVISLCEHDDIMNANQSQLDEIINADQSQLEDIIADQCQLHDIIKEEPFQLEDNMNENQCMEMQQDLQCADLLSDISTFDQQKNNAAEKQSTDNTSNLHQSHRLEGLESVCHNEHHVTEELQLLCQQGDSVTEDQRLMVAEANLRYGIPTVEYEVDHEESPVVEQPYLCTECRQRFSEHDDLEQHLWDHIAAMTGKHPHKCSKCPGRTFSDMKQHKRHHQMGLECDICGEAFHEAIILARHRMAAHARSKAYPCKMCKMTFTTRAELSQHKERHSKTKAFYCKMCSESFQSEVGLNVHMKTHSGSSKIRNIVREKGSPSHTSATKPHSCAHCRQDFISLEILQSHVKSEHSSASGINLICDVCQKSFLKLEDLKMHKTTHSDHKLYK